MVATDAVNVPHVTTLLQTNKLLLLIYVTIVGDCALFMSTSEELSHGTHSFVGGKMSASK